MMKHEFDNLIGITTAPEAYEKIEFVYMNSDRFQTKQELATFYKENDMNGIETIYKELVDNEDIKTKKLLNTSEFKAYIEDLAYFSESYVDSIKEKLIESAVSNFQNKTIVKLLSEYRTRKLKEEKEHFRDFLHSLEYGAISLSNDCMTNSSHYRTVLYDLLIR